MAKKLQAIDAIHSMIHRKRMNNMVQAFARGTDNVPAMLTPHEAVLNTNAAALEGKPAIDALNAIGNQMARAGVNLRPRGLPQGTSRVQHFYEGSGDVGPYQQYNPANADFEPTPIPYQEGNGNPSTQAGGYTQSTSGDIPGFGGNYYSDFYVNKDGENPLSHGGSSNNFTPPIDIPFGPYPALPGVMPNNSTGQKIGSFGGGLIGGIGGNLLLPVIGGIAGRWLGGKIGGAIGRGIQGPVGRVPGQASPSSASGAQPPPRYAPSQGFSPTGGTPHGREYWSSDFGRGLPSGQAGMGPGDFNPPGPMGGLGTFGIVGPSSPAGGGSFFGGSGSPIVPGSGFLNNAGSLGTLAGGRADYGALGALHSTNFLNAIQNMGYANLNDFLSTTGFTLPGSKGTSGQGVGGSQKPMTKAT